VEVLAEVQLVPEVEVLAEVQFVAEVEVLAEVQFVAKVKVLAEVQFVAEAEALKEDPVPPKTTKNEATFAEARCRKTYSSQFLPVSAGLQNQFPPPIRRKVSSPGQPVGETEKDLRFSPQPESPPRYGDFVE
jgi:hypothetical protein